ncbi:hypothetical protein VYU27_000901 [Nannochloropsis oceanica]
MEPFAGADLSDASCVCLGSGRFLRAVLVPAVEAAGLKSIVFQTRGNSFPSMMYGPRKATGTYEVDTVEFDGRVLTSTHSVVAAGTLGNAEGQAAWLSLPAQLPNLRVIGVGVTEAGLASGSVAMKDLARFLFACFKANVQGPLSVINTDNMPGNGPKIHTFVTDPAVLAELQQAEEEREAFLRYLQSKVVFHSTMVDRITSQRAGNGDVPRAEPLPKKALVIEDLTGVLPPSLDQAPGVVVRRVAGEIEVDHQLKLRIANAIHTAMVYCMALGRMSDTSACIGNPLILPYIHTLYQQDILPTSRTSGVPQEEVQAVYDDWVRRLQHPQFGLSCLFVCQNASQKLGIRLLPTIAASIEAKGLPGPAFAFAVAAMLRFLTPLGAQPRFAQNVFKGEMDDLPVCQDVGHVEEGGGSSGSGSSKRIKICSESEISYAGDMKADFVVGKYDFKDGDGTVPRLLYAGKAAADAAGLVDVGSGGAAGRVAVLRQAVEKVLGLQAGLGDGNVKASPFVSLVATFYVKMVEGTPCMDVLRPLVEGSSSNSTEGGGEEEEEEEKEEEDLSRPLRLGDIAGVVTEEMRKVQVIDLHTHLFPPSHGDLMLWGIDELLTYHYLIAEYFQTAPCAMTPDRFFALSKKGQADLIWEGLFIQRSPLSEACKGVLTTLGKLGLRKELRSRDLDAVRSWFAAQDPEVYCEKVFQLAGVKYCVMTNIPFDPVEAQHWRPEKKKYSRRFRSALRVDPLLKGDWKTVSACLKEAGYPLTLEGARQYLRDWATTMQPEYLMASTPHDFHFAEKEDRGRWSSSSRNGHEHGEEGCGVTMLDTSPRGAELLEKVLIPVAKELSLPIAMKLGAHRAVNPTLRTGGDGVVTADVGDLRRLCSAYPDVKFLATFLARISQHEAAVLANKFPNLHLYGCWWYCNNPSIIREITVMRIEILGTGFTAQHSDARVLDQLLYKWTHSRRVIGEVLAEEYALVAKTGWKVTKGEVRRDVVRLLGGAYEEFMRK